jgi:hypothetical protein
MWKYTLPSVSKSYRVGTFSSTGRYDVEGNVMSLLYGDNFAGQTDLSEIENVFDSLFVNNTGLVNSNNLILPATTLTDWCYARVFGGCTSLITTPELPATTLAQSCYYSMFAGCTSLETAPALQATTLAQSCYALMFWNCTSLVNAPQLPATTLVYHCYAGMFDGCTSLETAPQLPATTLAEECYNGMFKGCTSLTTAPVLPATTLAENCYNSMFNNCTSLNYIKAMFTTTPSATYTAWWVEGVSSSGTFVKNSAATWDVSGSNGIPSGWTIQTASE